MGIVNRAARAARKYMPTWPGNVDPRQLSRRDDNSRDPQELPHRDVPGVSGDRQAALRHEIGGGQNFLRQFTSLFGFSHPKADDISHGDMPQEVGGGQRNGGERHIGLLKPGMPHPDDYMYGLNHLEEAGIGQGRPVPRAFGAHQPARFDDSMEPMEPTRRANGLLGEQGSPHPSISYGSGVGPQNFMTDLTGGTHRGRMPVDRSQGPEAVRNTRQSDPRGQYLPLTSARLTGLPRPSDPVAPTRGSYNGAPQQVARGLFGPGGGK